MNSTTNCRGIARPGLIARLGPPIAGIAGTLYLYYAVIHTLLTA
jgi:hypothetical protein